MEFELKISEALARVTTGRSAIARQESIVQALRDQNQDWQLAFALLERFRRAQRIFEEDYEYLLQKRQVPRF